MSAKKMSAESCRLKDQKYGLIFSWQEPVGKRIDELSRHELKLD